MNIQFTVGILITILGAMVGSFLSVVIARTHKHQKDIWFGRSICPHCKKQLKWYYLFPIFSYLFLRGKCGLCGKRISAHYLGLEVLTAGFFLLAFIKAPFIDSNFAINIINYALLESFIFYIVLFTFLSLIFFYDLLYKEIPDRFSIPAIVIAVIMAFLTGTPALLSIGIALLIIVLFFGGQIVISRGAWLGGGDLRLGILMAVILGWKVMILALILSYIIGAVLSLILIASKKANRKTMIPFGPFLIMGLVVSMFWGELIITKYFELIY